MYVEIFRTDVIVRTSCDTKVIMYVEIFKTDVIVRTSCDTKVVMYENDLYSVQISATVCLEMSYHMLKYLKKT
jgi:hypothetical protein